MRNKKIAFLLEIPTSYIDVLFEKLLQRQDLDFEVLYCAHTEYSRGCKQERKIYPYKVMSGLRWTIVGDNIFVLKINPGIWNQLSRGGYDAVIIGGYIQPTMLLAILWCILNKVPYILCSESHNLTPRPILRRLLKWPLLKFAIKMASAFLATGSNSKDYLVSYGADPDRIFFFPNIPDVKKIAEESLNYRKDIGKLRRELNIRGNPVVIYSGRLIGVKNIATLLRAFQLVQNEMPRVGIIIIGEGPLRNSLKNLAGELKLNNVSFTGFIQPADLVKYYASADIFVLPSYCEQWGVVVLEATACGLPVVVSDSVGCARDIVCPNENGFVVSTGSVKELASVITKLIYDSELCKQMGRRAHEIAMKWDYDFSISQLMQALRIAIIDKDNLVI